MLVCAGALVVPVGAAAEYSHATPEQISWVRSAASRFVSAELAGDGALLMTGLEMLTAAHYLVAPVILVLRDGELGQIAQFQRMTLDRDPLNLHPHERAAMA